MPQLTLQESPMLPEVRPVTIHYREYGSGMPLVFLHGGWGYEIYPFDYQVQAFADRYRILIPDRTGYGRSLRIAHLPSDFHDRAVAETCLFLDALGIDKAVFWGHSDGAIIATRLGISHPERALALILEAFHYNRNKGRIHPFYEDAVKHPEQLSERVSNVLARDHGPDYWMSVVRNHARAWQQIAAESHHEKEDYYQGLLGTLQAPVLILQGELDPRSEPEELEAARRELPHSRIHIFKDTRHSPHSQTSSWEECNQVVAAFLEAVPPRQKNPPPRR